MSVDVWHKHAKHFPKIEVSRLGREVIAVGINLEVPCPECGAKLRCTLEDVERGRTKSCARGHRVALVDEGHGARKVNRELKKLDGEMAKLNRSLRRLR